jgi:transmembrane sensor
MKPSPTTPPVPPAKWEERPLDWPRAAGQVDRLMEALKVRERRQRRRRIAAASSVVVMILCGFWMFSELRPGSTNAPEMAAQKYRITSPERRTLSDGSLVELQAGAELAVNFSVESSGPRCVELVKGSAFFQVAKNPERPFIVTSGGVGFRAVGTAFSVGLDQHEVEMIVTEGRVAVDGTAPAVPNSSATIVAAGNRAVLDRARPDTGPVVTPTTETQVSQKLAWRVARLEFNETPLAEVVELLNRQRDHRLTLASPELGRVEISGALRADNLEPLLQMLAANYGIRAVRTTDGRIELHREK